MTDVLRKDLQAKDIAALEGVCLTTARIYMVRYMHARNATPGSQRKRLRVSQADYDAYKAAGRVEPPEPMASPAVTRRKRSKEPAYTGRLARR